MKDFFIIFSFFTMRFFLPLHIKFIQKAIALPQIYFYIIFDIVFILAIFFFYISQKNKKNIYFYKRQSFSIKNVTTNLILALLVAILLMGIAFIHRHMYTFETNIPSAFYSSPKILIFFVLMFSAFSEELFYRNYILCRLCSKNKKKYSIITAIFISSVLFSLSHSAANSDIVAHINVISFGFSSGIILSTLMILRKSIFANYLAHLLYNVGVVFLL